MKQNTRILDCHILQRKYNDTERINYSQNNLKILMLKLNHQFELSTTK